ncbi:pentapeptide repeat-containing protein [Leptolyngbya sp. FACHB-17]|uniref:pentapeptide repeat-containing protein n=1 Tax=unclassified Leptolyngbya TaxID=2650499 RepID=UPI0016816D07|nr:pentapeptide repeat-containing protein [Leptolyngbya sp. FACHB-17]MBD2078466.1 pentapeptide repeat-containing protein [Leptolyngbya sp. FACHB-17]
MGQYLDWVRNHKWFSVAILGGVLGLFLGGDWYNIQYEKVSNLRQQSQLLQKQIDALDKDKFAKDKLSLEKDLISLEKDRLTLENSITGSAIQAVGGLLLLVTAWVSIQNLRSTQKSVELAQKDLEATQEIAQKNLEAIQEKQVTERFTQAITQLGSDKFEVRLGAIYSLGRIAKDSGKDRWTIIEILISFIQERSPRLRASDSNGTEQTAPIPETSIVRVTKDVQAVLTVIGRRDVEDGEEPINLYNVYLVGVVLQGTLDKQSNLRNAHLVKADLREVKLNEVDLSEANLSEAKLSQAYLRKVNLRGARLHGATMSGTEFKSVIWQGADLFMADLTSAVLKGEDLSAVEMYLTVLTNAKMSDAIFKGSDLRQSNLDGADLRGADFRGAKLNGTIFCCAQLDGAKFGGATFNNKTNFICVTGLDPDEIILANNWKEAQFDTEFEKKLALLSEQES